MAEALETDSDPRVREHAASAVMHMGPDAFPLLLRALAQDEHARVRVSAALAIGNTVRYAEEPQRLAETSRKAVPHILPLLADGDPEVRMRASAALGRLRVMPERTVPAIADMLQDPEWKVRREAARALQRYPHDELKPVAPVLIEALGDRTGGCRNDQVRGPVTMMLAQMGAEVVPALSSALTDSESSPAVRTGIVVALSFIGSEAKAATPALIKALQDPDAMVRMCAAHAFTRIVPPTTDDVVVALTSALEDNSESVRGYAAEALRVVQRRAAAPDE
jgi:HEAT repeat protein